MPKDTYYNLPDEKRRRIFDAAIDELIRVPVSEMSINQIIQNAGISRGSFYQYFEDKHDLVQYILADYVEQLAGVVRTSMRKSGGNLFDGLRALFAVMVNMAEDEAVRKVLTNLIMEAGGGGCTFDYAVEVQRRIVEILTEEADGAALALESREDMSRMIRALFAVMKEAAGQCLHDFAEAESVRREFEKTLRLFQDRIERR